MFVERTQTLHRSQLHVLPTPGTCSHAETAPVVRPCLASVLRHQYVRLTGRMRSRSSSPVLSRSFGWKREGFYMWLGFLLHNCQESVSLNKIRLAREQQAETKGHGKEPLLDTNIFPRVSSSGFCCTCFFRPEELSAKSARESAHGCMSSFLSIPHDIGWFTFGGAFTESLAAHVLYQVFCSSPPVSLLWRHGTSSKISLPTAGRPKAICFLSRSC